MSEPQEPGPDAPSPNGTPPAGSPYGTPQPGPQGQYPPQGPYLYPAYGPPNPYGYAYDPEAKSKVAAGVLGIFLGGLGIHRFYLGYTGIGLTMLLVSVLGGIVTCGVSSSVVALWGFIEGILYLVGTPGTQWSVDATGRPLRG